jgi:hypothetical protein
MLIYNEQETRMRMGEQLFYDVNIYRLAGADPTGETNGKWAIQIKEILPDDPFYGFKICKCFSPPDDRFLNFTPSGNPAENQRHNMLWYYNI